MRPLSKWLPPAIGLLAGTTTAVLLSSPPGHPLHWPAIFAAASFAILGTYFACALGMVVIYAMLPAQRETKHVLLRTCAIAACLAPLAIFTVQRSLWSPFLAAFIVWTILPTPRTPKPYWLKFAISVIISALVQFGLFAEFNERILTSTLVLAVVTLPIAWRIRQERALPSPPRPRTTLAVAFLLAILALTHYLPLRFGSDVQAASVPNPTLPAPHAGGEFRGVILVPEVEKHVTLVIPLPMMGRDPFDAQKDPLSIPFYGVYWLFQAPDRRPGPDAFLTKGSPDTVSFRSVSRAPLKMEARQNLGRMIDVASLSAIDVAIRNADQLVGMEVLIVNSTLPNQPNQSLGQIQLTDEPRQTIHFPMPRVPSISEFDELSVRFPRPTARANRSAKLAIERFYLVPRGR